MRNKVAISKEACQKELLEISKMFHQICVDQGIPYYMIGGTMLGAVRHKGFIPWDDDIDFAVKREYYDKLVQILDSHLPNKYRVLTYINLPYPFEYLKIELQDSLVDDPERANIKGGEIGISIDVFPLDNCSNSVQEVIGVIKKKHLFDRLSFAKYFNMSQCPLHKRLIQMMVKLFFYNKDKYYWMNRYFKLLKELHNTGTGALINFASRYHEKEIIQESIWGTPVLYDFEDTKFFGVENYDLYLKHLFGEYMILPPVEKRHIHGDNYYIYE